MAPLLVEPESPDSEPVLGCEYPPEQLRGELVEPVARHVVAWRHDDEVSLELDHRHGRPKCFGQVEDVLERSGVNDRGERLVKLNGYRVVQVVYVGRVFVVGRVH